MSPAISGKVCKAGICGFGNLRIGGLKVKLLEATELICVLRGFFSKSKILPSWDVANYLYVISGVQGGGVGHTCDNNHLRNKAKNHDL